MLTKDNVTSDQVEHLNGIEEYVSSAAELTGQLLGFARGGKYEVRPTDMNKLVEKQNRLFGHTSKEISIYEKLQENIWTVEVDQGQFEQVLMNLYVNALQAMPHGGILTVETSNLTLDKDFSDKTGLNIPPGMYVCLSVSDTGIGMDEATKHRIFEPFFTTKEMGRGTGLGLATVYGVIKNHNGWIIVNSEPGHGTTFDLYLPAIEKGIPETTVEPETAIKGTETVMMVDDESMVVAVGVEMLGMLGYKVLTATGGRQALELFEENKDSISLIVLDMIMPGMSGGETFDRLKEIDPEVKVLLSSGYSIEGLASEIINRGCQGFIQKPFNMEQLSLKIREVLAG